MCDRPVLADVPCRICNPQERPAPDVYDEQVPSVQRTRQSQRSLGGVVAVLVGVVAVIGFVLYASATQQDRTAAFYATSTTSTTLSERERVAPVCTEFHALWADFIAGGTSSDPAVMFDRSKRLSDLSSERLAPIELSGATARMALAARKNDGHAFITAVNEVSASCTANGFPSPA